jgi:hypothetical protein
MVWGDFGHDPEPRREFPLSYPGKQNVFDLVYGQARLRLSLFLAIWPSVMLSSHQVMIDLGSKSDYTIDKDGCLVASALASQQRLS